jgi:ribose 5-phosphate isomerase A
LDLAPNRAKHCRVTTERRSAAELALEFVADGNVIGLGTGRAASAFVRDLGERVRAGLSVRGVPTSQATADLARQSGIPLVALDDVETIDVTVDGADEVDPHLDLIKGYGAAMVREKIVAAASRRLVILVGPEKLVATLGQRGRLPVEVIPFAAATCARRFAAMGLGGALREADGDRVVTDNGNYVFDCRVRAIADPAALDRELCCVPGVVGTGIFAGMADAVVVDDEGGARVMRRPG